MDARRARPHPSFAKVDPDAYEALLTRIRDDDPHSLRDIDDPLLEEKDHPWANRKPSKWLLSQGFWTSDLTISARTGMLKSYELTERHYGRTTRPAPASPRDCACYLLNRGLRTQGAVSLESMTYGDAPTKPEAALSSPSASTAVHSCRSRSRVWRAQSIGSSQPRSTNFPHSSRHGGFISCHRLIRS